jgi:hypothetical protein
MGGGQLHPSKKCQPPSTEHNEIRGAMPWSTTSCPTASTITKQQPSDAACQDAGVTITTTWSFWRAPICRHIRRPPKKCRAAAGRGNARIRVGRRSWTTKHEHIRAGASFRAQGRDRCEHVKPDHLTPMTARSGDSQVPPLVTRMRGAAARKRQGRARSGDSILHPTRAKAELSIEYAAWQERWTGNKAGA